MFFLLGLSIVLGAMLVVNCIASVITSLLWRLFRNRISRWPAGTRSQVLFLLRTVPAATSVVCATLLLLPAYLTHEPRTGHEDLSFKIGLLAVTSAIGIALAVVRLTGTWRATSRLTADWLQHAEQIRLPNVSIPAYRFQHQFPLIAIVGMFRPRLFIADQILASLTSEELSAALEHEAGHVAARDNLRRGLMRACRDLLLLIPCGRLLDGAWLEASELAADEYAARANQKTSLDLASALVKIARMIPAGTKPAMPAGAFLVDGSAGFRTRVRRLVHLAGNPEAQTTPISRFSRVPRWITIGLAIVMVSLIISAPQLLLKVHLLIEQAVRLLS